MELVKAPEILLTTKLLMVNWRLCHLLTLRALINVIKSCLKKSKGKELSKTAWVVGIDFSLSTVVGVMVNLFNEVPERDRFPMDGLLLELVDLEFAVEFLVLEDDLDLNRLDECILAGVISMISTLLALLLPLISFR